MELHNEEQEKLVTLKQPPAILATSINTVEIQSRENFVANFETQF